MMQDFYVDDEGQSNPDQEHHEQHDATISTRSPVPEAFSSKVVNGDTNRQTGASRGMGSLVQRTGTSQERRRSATRRRTRTRRGTAAIRQQGQPEEAKAEKQNIGMTYTVKMLKWMLVSVPKFFKRLLAAFRDPPASAAASRDAIREVAVRANGVVEDKGLGALLDVSHNPALKYSYSGQDIRKTLDSHRVQIVLPPGAATAHSALFNGTFASVLDVQSTQSGAGMKSVVATVKRTTTGATARIPVKFLHELPKLGEIFTPLQPFPCVMTNGKTARLTCHPGGVFRCLGYREMKRSKRVSIRFTSYSPLVLADGNDVDERDGRGVELETEDGGVSAAQIYVFSGASANGVRVFSPRLMQGSTLIQEASGAMLFSPRTAERRKRLALTRLPPAIVASHRNASEGVVDASYLALNTYMHGPKSADVASRIFDETLLYADGLSRYMWPAATAADLRRMTVVLHPFQRTAVLFPVSGPMRSLQFEVDSLATLFDATQVLKVDLADDSALSYALGSLHRSSAGYTTAGRDFAVMINQTVRLADAASTGGSRAVALETFLDGMPASGLRAGFVVTSSIAEHLGKYAKKFGHVVADADASGVPDSCPAAASFTQVSFGFSWISTLAVTSGNSLVNVVGVIGYISFFFGIVALLYVLYKVYKQNATSL
ncbi:unnamed protein product [Amoebophrya sp. A120]|nr:unnamed protein product [Amoebophrya sp. A120]|eukprot:GSA120T00010770001.1